MTILVSGANGFVGRAVCELASIRGLDYRSAVRRPTGLAGEYIVGDIDAGTDWRAALTGVDVVIHLAGRAHVMSDGAADSLAAYREVNVAGSVALARQAVEIGVRRLVYVSSIKACCEQTFGTPCTEDAPAHQEDAYGQSKFEAEQSLSQIAAETGLELVIVRPVMVVGPRVKGNLALLARVLRSGLPLPLAGIGNRRSLIDVDCLADLLLLCAQRPEAVGQTFLAAAKETISTEEMVKALARGMNCNSRLWHLPVALLSSLGTLTGRSEVIRRLLTDLEVDSSKASRLLGWSHHLSIEDALAAVGHSLRRRF